MTDEIVKINSLLYEHGAMKHYVRMLDDSASEQEAVFLEKAREWDLHQLQVLADKRVNLEHAITSITASVIDHYAREEAILQPLIGDLLTRGLVAEHKEILQSLNKAKSLLNEVKLEELTRDELMAKNYEIRHAVDTIGQLISTHHAKEDAMLDLLKKAIRVRRKR